MAEYLGYCTECNQYLCQSPHLVGRIHLSSATAWIQLDAQLSSIPNRNLSSRILMSQLSPCCGANSGHVMRLLYSSSSNTQRISNCRWVQIHVSHHLEEIVSISDLLLRCEIVCEKWHQVSSTARDLPSLLWGLCAFNVQQNWHHLALCVIEIDFNSLRRENPLLAKAWAL